ncbi:sulfurtransferase TusA family protein [uncultured Oscillibacter sp.]|uniref:sulfurtransferase TusA family protein n=1 Tax=uncultured Oscillibacter sp. TaxID=876091 RepID=UPI0025EAE7D8|nr:sulfurtransferase TusA family protein [uncultured Oscillibacter sp.]
MEQIDARGLSCPEPVILARRAMASGKAAYQILVDNPVSRENVTRYGEHQGYRVSVEERDGVYTLTLTRP